MTSDALLDTGGVIIRFHITSVPAEFARAVLRKETYEQLIQYGEIMGTIAPTWAEMEALRVHPMHGNILHYRTLLRRTELFLVSAVEHGETARQIVMQYQMYAENVTVTSIEHYLWICTTEQLRQAVASAGFPVGEELEKAQKEHHYPDPIDRYDCIKALVDIGGITNSLAPPPGSKFMLRIRSPLGDTTWYKALI